LGAIFFNLGKERLAGVPWRRFLAWALGDAMVVVFFGWLVLILGGYIRTYIGIFETTACKIEFRWNWADRIWREHHYIRY
jgi:1,4-dihydroxy-2-naphthoate octaprenyltransferase